MGGIVLSCRLLQTLQASYFLIGSMFHSTLLIPSPRLSGTKTTHYQSLEMDARALHKGLPFRGKLEFFLWLRGIFAVLSRIRWQIGAPLIRPLFCGLTIKAYPCGVAGIPIAYLLTTFLFLSLLSPISVLPLLTTTSRIQLFCFQLLRTLLCSWILRLPCHTCRRLCIPELTSMSQMVLFFSFLSGLFLLLYFMVLGGSLNPEAISPYDAWEGVYWCPAGFYYTALIILGFYLGEISRLTSSQGVPGLSLMKIPAIVFIVVTWCILISEMVTTAADGTGLDSVNNTMLFSFFFAWIGVILPFAVSAVLAWGVISLLRSLGSAQGSKLRFFRIIAIVLFAIACMWTFLLVNALMFYIPGDFLDRMGSLQWNLLLWDYYWLRDLMYLLGVALPLICVILNFQISVQKEIELSKSGTSSTSSASSSSSSSSSSSQNDPVIEL